MGVERQNHHLIHPVSLDVRHRGLGEGVPVAHGHVAGGFHTPLTQKALQLARLLLSDPSQGRATADRSIGLLGFAAAQGADQPCQGLLKSRNRQPDDLRIGEKVEQERSDVLNALRATQVEQYDTDPSHVSQRLQGLRVTPINGMLTLA